MNGDTVMTAAASRAYSRSASAYAAMTRGVLPPYVAMPGTNSCAS